MSEKLNVIEILCLGCLATAWILGATMVFYGVFVSGVRANCATFDVLCPMNGIAQAATVGLQAFPWLVLPSEIAILGFFLFGAIGSFMHSDTVKLTPEQAKELETFLNEEKQK